MTLVVLLVAGLLAVLAARGRPLQTFAVLVGTVLLVPATMTLPGSPTQLLTVTRLVEIGAAVGVLRGPRLALRRPLPHVLLLLVFYAGAACITGVALAGSQIDPVEASYSWALVFDQVVVAVLAVALARRMTSSEVIVVLAFGASAAAAIGVLEWVTGVSWARTLLQAALPNASGVPAAPLEHRNGAVRVRGATEFALAYGWLMAALLPVVAVSMRLRAERWGATTRILLVPGIVLVPAAEYLSRGRSPLLVLMVLAAVLFLLLMPRTPSVLLGSALLLGLGAFQYGPELLRRLLPSADQSSVDVRVHRLPQVLELGAGHPFRGNGLTAIQRLGPGFVDSSYLQVYVELGAVVALLFVLALVVSTTAVGRGAWGSGYDPDRLLALAAASGMAALVVGSAFFDGFTTLSTALTFWALAGVGLVAAERRCGPLRRPSLRVALTPARLLLVLAVVALGFVGRLLTPVHTTASAVYATLGAKTEFGDSQPGLGRTYITTLCQTAREVLTPGAPWHLDSCEELTTPGRVRVKVSAEGAGAATAGLATIRDRVRQLPHLSQVQELPEATGAVEGLLTAARVAPVGLGLLAATGILLVPARRRDDVGG